MWNIYCQECPGHSAMLQGGLMSHFSQAGQGGRAQRAEAKQETAGNAETQEGITAQEIHAPQINSEPVLNASPSGDEGFASRFNETFKDWGDHVLPAQTPSRAG